MKKIVIISAFITILLFFVLSVASLIHLSTHLSDFVTALSENFISSVVDLVILSGLITLISHVIQTDIERKRLIRKLEITKYFPDDTVYRNKIFFDLCLSKLKNISLCGQDLSFMNISFHDGDRVILKKWNLSNGKFIKSNISNVNFINCKFNSVSLNGAELTNVSFENCDFAKSYCKGTTFKRVTFTKCNLNQVQFENAHLTGINFTTCMNINSVKFTGADLRRAIFSLSVKNTVLSEARYLKSVNFSEKNKNIGPQIKKRRDELKTSYPEKYM